MSIEGNSNLNMLMVKLKEKISLGEGIRYSVPDLWNCFDYNGQEKFVDEKGVTLVNPYRFYYSCINDFIMVKKDITKDYNKSISQTLRNFNEKKEYLGGDWIMKSSVYIMNVKSSTAWDHDGSGFLEDCNTNSFKETGTFLKTIALLPLLKKMGIDTICLLPILKFSTIVKEEAEKFFVIDSELKDNMVGEDFTIEEEFSAFIEACHILGIRVNVDIISEVIIDNNDLNSDVPVDLMKNQQICDELEAIISYYQNSFGIDGAKLALAQSMPEELCARLISNSRTIDNDFCFIQEGLVKGDEKFTRENGYNIICGFNQGLDARISDCNTNEFMHEFINGLNEIKGAAFVCAEALDKPRLSTYEDGKILSKFLTIINEFLPNSVPVIISGFEIYETKPFNSSLDLSWINDSRWEIPDALGAISKIRNEFIDTFTNANNFYPINFESPYTTAIGFAYIIEDRKYNHNDNIIIVVGNADLKNPREYTLFLENIRNEAANVSKKAWLMYSQYEWSHDIYDFNHESDLQLSFKPGEVKILII